MQVLTTVLDASTARYLQICRIQYSTHLGLVSGLASMAMAMPMPMLMLMLKSQLPRCLTGEYGTEHQRRGLVLV